MEHTYGECLALCSEVTENEAMCPGFCDFVNHLYTHDGTIFDTFTNLYHQDDDVVVSITCLFFFKFLTTINYHSHKDLGIEIRY